MKRGGDQHLDLLHAPLLESCSPPPDADIPELLHWYWELNPKPFHFLELSGILVIGCLSFQYFMSTRRYNAEHSGFLTEAGTGHVAQDEHLLCIS